ncbi:glycoside hydrolase [Pluteus cervinus]|uniref:Glycoside hydrolase n=1 Tax=Pluteus cervinus TaxID=181527 RepID=A0ACD3BG06_9AGAR|nr:glycoside hydrolase [Pluteus cervinus]
MRTFAFLLAAASSLKAAAFDNSRYDNVALYWGQNSYGAGHTDVANFQKPLAFYCQDDTVDVFPVAFLNVFFGPGGLPSINLANTCNPVDNATFPGSTLPNCATLSTDIASCQAKGKLVTLSLGGQSGAVGFQSDSQAETFAQTIWDLFLGGSSSTRPFGNAILDGVDLDIEGGTSAGYAAFVNKIQALAKSTGRKYYITAAPQCVYPDAALSGVLNSAYFDAIYAFGQASNWNFGIWDNWARTISPNPNVKVYIGAPASTSASGSGYVDIATLSKIATQMRNSFPSFGGVMLWDASQAYANGRYDLGIKQTLRAAGGTGFTYPPCSAPAYVSGNSYTAGSQVSYNGYIWQAMWWASSQPAASSSGEWSAISACGGPSVPPPPTTTTTSTLTSSTTSSTSTSPTTTSTTSTSPTSSPAPGSCSNVPAWSSGVAYTGGQQVVYNSHLWTAKWWTQADTPGGAAGVWTDSGPCTASKSAAEPDKIPRNLSPNAILSRFFRYL